MKSYTSFKFNPVASKLVTLFAVFIVFVTFSTLVQSGGQYGLSHNVATSGGDKSGDGNFVPESSILPIFASSLGANGSAQPYGGFASFLAPQATTCTPLPANLVSWYRAEGNAIDQQGNHNGELLNGTTFAPGRVSEAFSFDGVDDMVNSPDSSAFDVASAVTIEAWVKTTSTVTGDNKLIAGRPGNYQLAKLADGRVAFAVVINGTFINVFSIATLPANTFTHVAGTYDASTGLVNIYLDGSLVGTTVTSGNPDPGTQPYPQPFQIGGFHFLNNFINNFGGQIDEVSLYNRALSASEIQSIFDSGSDGKCVPVCTPPPSNLVSWYRAENNAADSFGTNNGTLQNGAGFTAGKVGQSFNLDGDDDYLDIGDLAQLDNATELTVMAWVKRQNTGSSLAGIIGKFDTGGSANNSFLLYLGEPPVSNKGLLLVEFGNNTFAGVQGTSEIPFDEWTFVAATWRNSDGQFKLYKNGMEDGVSIGGIGQTMKSHRAYTAKIGEWGVLRNSPYKFPGQIDEPAIFNRALTASEIQAIFNASSAGMCVSSALQISPTAQTVNSGGTVNFIATGGTPPYTFSLFTNNSGATINLPTAGTYTAGASVGVDTVRVTDAANDTVDATVTVTAINVSCSGGQKVWDGSGSTNNWSEAANWCNDTLPTSGQTVVFDGTSTKNATIDVNISVAAININNTYTGNITQAAGVALTVGNYTQSGGTFTGGSGNIDVSGSFVLSGGTFTSASGTLFVGNSSSGVNFAIGAGSGFEHNNGKVEFDGVGVAIDVASNETFNDVSFNAFNNFNTTIAAADTLIVTGTLTLSDGFASSGIVEARGAVIHSANFDGGSSNVRITQPVVRTITLQAPGKVPTLTLATDAVTIETAGAGTISGNAFNLEAGVVNQGNVPLAFSGAYNQSGGTFTGGGVNLTTGNFTLSNGSFSKTSGVLTVGNYTQSGGTFTGGSGNIDVSGSFVLSGGTFTSASGTLFVGNSSSGVNFAIGAGSGFEHNNGKVEFDGVGVAIDVASNETFNDVSFNAFNNFNTTIAAADTLIVTGTLTLSDGFASSGGGGTGTVSAQGNVVVASSFDGGNSALTFSGSANQTYTNNGGVNPTGIWTVNKTSGTLTAASSLTLGTSTPLNITSGTLYLNNGSNLTSAALTLAANGRLVNDSTTTITLGGNLANSGIVDLQGSGAACPESDTILLRSSVAGTRRSWTGAGLFRLVDVDVKDMGGSAPVTVFSGTDSGNNNTNWTFNSGCPTAVSISPSVVSRVVNQTQTFTAGGGFAPRTFSLLVNNSGATINASTGLYTAGSTFGVSDTVRVTDAFGSIADAIVSVTGPPARVAFIVQPTNTRAGQSITPALQVALQDNVGNTVTNATNAITIAIGNNAGGSTLSGTVTQNAIDGIATFNNLSLNQVGTGYRLVASSGSLISATSNAFNIIPGVAMKLAFTVQPSNTKRGAIIAPAIKVEVQDENGNLVTDSLQVISLSIKDRPVDGILQSGTLQGNITKATVSGVATFDDLRIVGGNGGHGYTLLATSGTLFAPTSNIFNIFGPTQLVFTVQPSNAKRSALITPSVKVEVQDENGDLVTDSLDIVVLSIKDSPGGGTLQGSIAKATVSGVATFDDLRIVGGNGGHGYTLLATSGTLFAPTSNIFNIFGPTQLVFTVQPSNTDMDAIISPAIQIQVQDENGDLVTDSLHAIGLFIFNNPGGGTLQGSASKLTVSGVATFDDLRIVGGNGGHGYTLGTIPGVLPTLISNPFDIFNSFAVTNTNDSGAGSLRQTIINANNTPGQQTISFNIPGTAPFTVAPTSPLPGITDPVVIDGTTQPGYAGSPIVELSGANSPSSNGFDISAGNSTVKGLVINRFSNSYGIFLRTNGSNTIQGNYFGTNVAGDSDQGNLVGIYIFNSPSNVIGGNTAGARNLLSGHEWAGIVVWDQIPSSNGTVIKGNYIGTNASGTGAVANSVGIALFETQDVTIGGAQTGERNIISGNSNSGIQIQNFIVFDPSTIANINIKGNYIGTNVSGTAAIANGSGIYLFNSYGHFNANITNVTIGGTQSGEGNLISGNQGYGVATHGKLTNLNIKGNYIGTDASGTNGIPNLGGVVIYNSSLSANTPHNITIGGTQSAESNIIAFNLSTPVWIGDGSNGVSVRRNSIHSNAEYYDLGIDLAPQGFNWYDSCDADSGPNLGQNPPVLNSASSSSGSTTIEGLLYSAANQTYTLDFYSNETCDFQGRGEGKVYLGTKTITSGSSCGSAGTSFSATLPGAVAAGHQVMATTTDSQGNTSEFSLCVGPSAKIEGTILDQATNQPIQGVQVELIDTTQAVPQPLYASTTSSGRFKFEKLPLGKNYRVKPAKLSYSFTPSSRTYSNLTVNQDDQYSGTKSIIIKGQMKRLTRAFNPASSAAANGKSNPLLPINIEPFGVSGVTMTLSGAANRTVTTDIDGNYTIANLQPGTYTLTPSRAGHIFTPPSTTLTVSDDQTSDFTAESPLDGLTGRFVFDGSRDIHAMNANGSGEVVIIHRRVGGSHFSNPDLARDHTSPGISLNGIKVVYTSTSTFETSSPGVSELSTGFSDGNNRALIRSNGQGFGGATFSPDGTKIAFHDEDGIYVMNQNGSNVMPIHLGSGCTDPDWSPDGLKLTYSWNGSVFIENADGTGFRTQFDTGSNVVASFPQWSPDGTKIAFIRRLASGEYQIARRDIDIPGLPEPLTILATTTESSYSSLTWSPDGLWLGFIKNTPHPAHQFGLSSLVAIAIDGSTQLVVKEALAASTKRVDWGGSGTVPTPPGNPVNVGIGGASVSFPTVGGGGGTTIITPVSPPSIGSAGSGSSRVSLSSNFALGDFAYDITTTANFTPPASVCFTLPTNMYTTQNSFNALHILHKEGNLLVDRTSSRDFATRKICASVNSFSPFVLAQQIDSALPSISGLVVDQNGNPLRDMPIALSGDAERFGKTDSNGFFNFVNLAQGGNYFVEPTASGFIYNLPYRSFINLSGEETLVFTATVTNFTVSGTVRSAIDQPLSGVTIKLNGAGEAQTVTDATGNYSFTGLPADGAFVLTPFKSGFSFTPSQVSIGPLTNNLTNINFVSSVSAPPANQPPTAASDAASTNQNTPVTIAVLANDNDPDGDFLSVTTMTQASNGAVAINANNTLTYTPNSAFTGADSFTYTISDGRGGSASATVTVTVSQGNRPPTAVCQNLTRAVAANCQAVVTAQEIGSSSSDPDGDAITLTISPAGPFNVGTHSVTLTVTDSRGASASCNATLTVVDNTPPTITCPPNVTATAQPGSNSAVVNYTAPQFTDNCSGAGVVCLPPSGSSFPTGVTTVNCTVTDASNNTAQCSFTVTVSATAPPADKIAFDTTRDGNLEIYSMNADGTSPTRLTNNSALDFNPAWSPDRTKLAFTSSRTGNGDIYVMNADGTNLIQLTSSSAIEDDASWSPDGTRIAFWSSRDGNPEIYVMNANGSSQTRITSHPLSDTQPQWSPDGSKLVFVSNRNKLINFDIYTMNANGSEVTRLTTNLSIDESPDWSPDGTKIIFTSNRSNLLDFEIWVMNANGTNQTRLTTSTRSSVRPSWSRNGSEISFATNRHSLLNFEIYTMNANGSNQTRLTNNSAVDSNPDR